MIKKVIEFADFSKIQLVVGTIEEVQINEKAKKPAYVIKINFGEKIGKKISSAQITNYTIEELTNRQIIAVCNFERKNIAGVESEVLVLGAINETNNVILLKPDIKVKNGSTIS
tara:strand:+ start:840 stop:1181 length:342 start_codon:yes stop_codon:yes gene_type:complete